MSRHLSNQFRMKRTSLSQRNRSYGPAPMYDICHNAQVVEKPELSSGGVAFFSGKEKSAADYEQELFYHIVVDGAEQVVKPAQAAVVTRILEAVYRSAESGETIYFD